MKRIFYLLFLVPVFIFSESLYSPTWGFKLNLPEGYEYVDGDGRDRFSFEGPAGAKFDVVVYNGVYPSMGELVNDINRRLGNRGDVDFFEYRDKQAAIIELDLADYSGWSICVELGSNTQPAPMLLALAYSPTNVNGLGLFHLSALDSIIPSYDEEYYPGPIMEYSFPRGERKQVPLANGMSAMIYENDAEAAQFLVEREFIILENYASTPYWMEAWIRYYRVIYRDSYTRVAEAVSALARNWRSGAFSSGEEQRTFAQRALAFVQGFNYERHLEGSDFVNLVTAITEGRGDCDSRAMLWAIILSEADIRAAMMVSPQHSHAMGLADIPGSGARFDAYETRWLVAETTANIDIGLIAQEQSDPAAWFGIIFE